jgi:hypothetical protein
VTGDFSAVNSHNINNNNNSELDSRVTIDIHYATCFQLATTTSNAAGSGSGSTSGGHVIFKFIDHNLVAL